MITPGTSESGKSTVAKQLRLLHQDTWNTEERMKYKALIYTNVISSLKTVIEAARRFKYAFTPENEVRFRFLFSHAYTLVATSCSSFTFNVPTYILY
jgi:hypothetical protein